MTKNINGDVYSDLITSADSREMNFGDDRESVEFIVIHHNATTNKDVAINTWTVAAGNQTSAHYEVTPDEIIGIVGENHVAWHAGGTGANDVPTIPRINQRSIGIENLNSTGAPDWLIDEKTYVNLAALVADICKRYNLPINRSTVKKHNEITKTACPGGIDIDKVIALANGENDMASEAVFADKNGVWYTDKQYTNKANGMIKHMGGFWCFNNGNLLRSQFVSAYNLLYWAGEDGKIVQGKFGPYKGFMYDAGTDNTYNIKTITPVDGTGARNQLNK